MNRTKVVARVPPIATVLLFLLAVLLVAGYSGDGKGLWWWLGLGWPTALLWVGVGSLVASRQLRNPVGWIVMAMGVGFALWFTFSIIALVVLTSDPSSGIGLLLAWVGNFAPWALLVLLPFLFLLFPDGHALSRRWRIVGWLIAVGGSFAVASFALTPDPAINNLADYGFKIPNPISIPALAGVGGAISGVGGICVFAGGVIAAFSLWLRFRQTGGDERQQIRWLAWVGATAVAAFGLQMALFIVLAALGLNENQWVSALLFWGFFSLFIASLAIGIPVATGIAVLKYRLYELDVVIKKAVVFGILVVLLALVFFVLALLVGGIVTSVGGIVASGGELPTIVPLLAAVTIGVLIAPLWRLSRRIAERVVYGGRASPYEVLTEFSGRLSETYATDDVLPRMATILAGATRARETRVWLRVGAQFRPAAAWPQTAERVEPVTAAGDALPPFGDAHAVGIRDRGELLGALTVETPLNDALDAGREKLIDDVAAQAGLVLRNVRLIEDLRASRQRLVAAQDEERRKLERNIHDGAQQQLVALTVKLKLLGQLATRDADKATALADQLQLEAADALEDLRDLARGIYPPLLADKGLAVALESQARKTPVPVIMDDTGIGRYAQETEAAVYFCALEALQNVAKYANASRVRVRLDQTNGELTFSVADDGTGFDPTTAKRGAGVTNMADRLAALGGAFEIRSTPGQGTTVTGRVPVGVMR